MGEEYAGALFSPYGPNVGHSDVFAALLPRQPGHYGHTLTIGRTQCIAVRDASTTSRAPDQSNGPCTGAFARWACAAGVGLVLEPIDFPATATYQPALFEAGIPATAFITNDVQAEYDRLQSLGDAQAAR